VHNTLLRTTANLQIINQKRLKEKIFYFTFFP